jgi:DNA-binding PadR family transcriptional regulator
VSGAWEPVARSREEGRPPRRYYRLTQSGEALLAEALDRYPAIASAYVTPTPKRV